MNEIADYIQLFPEDIQNRLSQLRLLIHQQCECTEKIYYNMPGFFYKNKALISFAGYKKHIGLYPGLEVCKSLKEVLKTYKSEREAIQLPHTQELPINLINQVIKLRIQIIDIETEKSS